MKDIMRSFNPIPYLLIGLLLFSCDKIENPYEEKEGEVEAGECPVPAFPSTNVTTKNVLIEDLTGHTCGNCPGAAVEARNIHQNYGDKVIIASVHMGYFAEPDTGGGGDPNSYVTDFRTKAGNEYLNTYSVSGFPKGMINRSKVINNQRVLGISEWSNATDSLIGKPTDVVMQMVTEYDPSNRKLCAHVQTRFQKDLLDTLGLTLYLVEDSVIDWQKNYSTGGDPSYPSGDVENYVHRHVLRDNINGTWGSTIVEGAVSSSDTLVNSYSYTVDNEWNDQHLSVIAYVYDRGTDEILQVIERHVPSK